MIGIVSLLQQVVLKENQCHTTSVLRFLSDMSILKVKLVYTAVSGVLLFLSISDIDHNGTKDLKTIAIFPITTQRKGNRWVTRVLIILGKAKSSR